MLPSPGLLSVYLSPGEFFDRRAVLMLKRLRLPGVKAAVAHRHLSELTGGPAAGRLLGLLVTHAGLAELNSLLFGINDRLWSLEDEIRRLDAAAYDLRHIAEFVDCAQQIYRLNDRRGQLKAQIDALFGMQPEPKQYTSYQDPLTE